MDTATTPADLSSMSGLDFLQAMRDNLVPRPGAGNLLDMSITELAEGRAVFAIEARPEFGNPLGSVHGGMLATLLDSAMGCAVHTTLPPGVGYTTVDLAVTFVKSVPFDGRLLLGEGRVIHRGSRIATAEGRVVDGEGRLVATATTTCMILG